LSGFSFFRSPAHDASVPKHPGQNIRVPLFYAEVSNTMANSATLNQRALIIGQINSASLPNSIPAGTGTPNVPVISQGVSDAASVGGPGSMLHLMTQAYRLNDTFGEVWYLPLADDGGGRGGHRHVRSHRRSRRPTARCTCTSAGVRIAVSVLSTQTTAQIATAIAAAVNATRTCPSRPPRRPAR
jgi:phage tail sheath gpL-like